MSIVFFLKISFVFFFRNMVDNALSLCSNKVCRTLFTTAKNTTKPAATPNAKPIGINNITNKTNSNRKDRIRANNIVEIYRKT